MEHFDKGEPSKSKAAEAVRLNSEVAPGPLPVHASVGSEFSSELAVSANDKRSLMDILIDEISHWRDWIPVVDTKDPHSTQKDPVRRDSRGKHVECDSGVKTLPDPSDQNKTPAAEDSCRGAGKTKSEDADSRSLMFFADKFRNGIASGFSLIDSAPGVSLYRNGDEYVISTNLAVGAQVDVVHGEPGEASGKSVYGGPNPSFARLSPDQALAQERKKEPSALGVVNAEFFANFPRNAVPIAFPLMENSKVLSEGFAATNKHMGNRLTLALGEKSARIIPFDNEKIEEFRNLQAENAIVSLSPRVNIDGASASKVGRTFLGLGNPNSDGSYSRVLIFVSPASSQAHAELTLREFGAGPTMMLDGGSSSQFRWKESNYIYPGRTVPNFLSIVPARAK